MPDGSRIRKDGHGIKCLDQFEQAFQNVRFREILFDFLFGESITFLAQFFGNERHVPGFHLVDAEFCFGKCPEFFQIFFSERPRFFRKVFQKRNHFIRCPGHFRDQRNFRIIGVAKQIGFFFSQAQQFIDVAGIVPFRVGTQFRCPGCIGTIHFFAQFPVFGILHDRIERREVQGEFIPALVFVLCHGTRDVQIVFGQALQIGFVFNQQLEMVGRVQHVFGKTGGKRSHFFLNVGKLLLLVFRQFGATETEIAQGIVDDPFLGVIKAVERRAVADGFVFFEQGQILGQRCPEFGYLRQVFIVCRAQFRCIDDSVQMADDAPCTGELFGAIVQRSDEIVPADFRHGRFQSGYDCPAAFQQGIDGR